MTIRDSKTYADAWETCRPVAAKACHDDEIGVENMRRMFYAGGYALVTLFGVVRLKCSGDDKATGERIVGILNEIKQEMERMQPTQEETIGGRE
jgi:hypothetical protein